MKRDYHHHHTNPGNFSSTGSCSSSEKAGMWPADDGVDELFAVLGYNVKCSDMAEVAQKIKQLEEAMESVQPEGLSPLASDTVHYNPSDLSSWLESMISGIEDPFLDSSTITTASTVRTPPPVDLDDFGSDLISIPGEAVYPPRTLSPPPHSKRLKTSGGSPPVPGLPALAEPARPVVLVDSQENGIRLVHSLMTCGDAVQQGNLKLAKALVKSIGFLAVSQAGAMGKVATYFAKALESRIYRPHLANPQDSAFTDSLQMHFYEACPYLKFAHFTANQAILEAFAGKSTVHVIDFSMKQGMQWPVLLQALARRPEGPPTFRLTAIGHNDHKNADNLQQVLRNLAQFAETVNVRFECGRLSLADLKPSMFGVREGETVAVNSIFELHQSLARPGAVDKVLQVVRDLKPEILTVAEQEANHNGSVFLDRFTESLHYYSTLFDSLESAGVSVQDKVMSEVYLGLQICNVVASEGVDRVERHESLAQWRTRFCAAGFEPVHLGSNAFKEASMLLEWFAGGDGYRVEENNGCLMLGWHTRPLIATSAWKLGEVGITNLLNATDVIVNSDLQ